MALLHIALQDGFQGDTVKVLVNGRDVAQKEKVTTRTQIGLPDSFEKDMLNFKENTRKPSLRNFIRSLCLERMQAHPARSY